MVVSVWFTNTWEQGRRDLLSLQDETGRFRTKKSFSYFAPGNDYGHV